MNFSLIISKENSETDVILPKLYKKNVIYKLDTIKRKSLMLRAFLDQVCKRLI